VSWLSIALLTLAVLVLIGAEWPKLARGTAGFRRGDRARARRKAGLTLVRDETDRADSDEFAASVQRDLSQLPTIEEDRKRGHR